ncbi:MAG: hypothetical protein K8R53_02795 [Bacteroidales bacterium]|nr:hypothetical protein [Bacteroidales bacterium]
MENESFRLILIFGILGLVIIASILLAIFFKPGKRLIVNSKIDQSEKDEEKKLLVTLQNIGNKRMKIVSPFIKFKCGSKTRLFQVKPSNVTASFPKVIKPGDKCNFAIHVGSYARFLKKKSLEIKAVKIIIKDTVGIKFQSEYMMIV